MSKGKLIVLEGMDGSGKTTQYGLLSSALEQKGFKVHRVNFPDYDEPSSALVRMYLSGQFGDSPDVVNCYAASAFFAVDRAASYLRKWKNALDNGEIVITDRYTTSNMVHQTSKLCSGEWDAYLEWLYDFEFNKIGLPVPDAVFYLKVTSEISEQRLSKRYNNDESMKDIHEKDEAYLKSCEKSGMYAAEKFGWHVIECASGLSLRSIDDIHSELLTSVLRLINGE